MTARRSGPDRRGTPAGAVLLRSARLFVGVAAALLLTGCAQRGVTSSGIGGDVAAATPRERTPSPDPLRRDPFRRDSFRRDPFRRDVVQLRSEDFVQRSQAARRLVVAGEAALPALGEAGEAPVVVHGAQQVSTTRPVLASIMQDLPAPDLERHLGARWPVVRRAAAEEIGHREGWTPVPALMDRMADADPEVRSAAASSLRRLTNRFFGFDARADARAREQAERRWRGWWSIECRVRAAEGRRPGEG